MDLFSHLHFIVGNLLLIEALLFRVIIESQLAALLFTFI